MLPDQRGISWLIAVSYSDEISPRVDSPSKIVVLSWCNEQFSRVKFSSDPAIIQSIEIPFFSIYFSEVI